MKFNTGQPLLNSSRHSRSMSKEMRILSLTLKSPRKAKIYLLLIENWAKIFVGIAQGDSLANKENSWIEIIIIEKFE